MIDALVAEARLRWGLDLAAGLQVAAAERLIATPLEPSRPLLVGMCSADVGCKAELDFIDSWHFLTKPDGCC